MGSSNSSEVELFNYLSSKTPAQVDKALKQLWDQEDTDKSGFLEKNEYEHFFRRVYNYLAKEKKVAFKNSEAELIETWTKIFDKNKDGKISWDEFRQSTANLVLHPLAAAPKEAKEQKKHHRVIIINRISLIDLPATDIGKGLADPYLKVKHEGEEKSTEYLKDKSDPVWWPNYLYYIDEQRLGNFEISVFDSDIGKDDFLGTFNFNGDAILKKFKENDQNVIVTEAGELHLSDKVAKLAKEQNKVPKWSVDVLYQEWGVDYGLESGDIPLNRFNKTFWAAVSKVKAVPTTAEEVTVPTKKKASKWEKDFVSPKIPIGVVELTVPKTPFLVDVLNHALCLIEFEEDRTTFKSRKEGREVLGKMIGSYIPTPVEGEWDNAGEDVTSDRVLTRFFFYGIGATRLRHNPDGTFHADFNPLLAYPVRNGYVPYQGKVCFDEKAQVTHIEIQDQIIKPGDEKWEWAKYVVRSTTLVIVTAYEHLVQSHFIWSNFANSAASAHLHPDHPIRRLLHVHSYRTGFINRNGSRSLAPKGGILDRLFAFPHDTLIKIFEDSFDNFKFYTFPQWMEDLGMKDVDGKIYPLAQDGLDYWKVVQKYVTEYLHTYYNDTDKLITNDPEVLAYWEQLQSTFPNGVPALSLENAITFFTQVIHYVSGMHTQAGNTSVYARDPAFAGSVIIDNSLMTLPQNALCQSMLIVATVGKQPMMTENFGHLMLPDAYGVWQNFNKELLHLSDIIDERNKTRPWIFNNMNPKWLVTSVAV